MPLNTRAVAHAAAGGILCAALAVPASAQTRAPSTAKPVFAAPVLFVGAGARRALGAYGGLQIWLPAYSTSDDLVVGIDAGQHGWLLSAGAGGDMSDGVFAADARALVGRIASVTRGGVEGSLTLYRIRGSLGWLSGGGATVSVQFAWPIWRIH